MAANLATLRPLIHHISAGGQPWALRGVRPNGNARNGAFDFQELNAVVIGVDGKEDSQKSLVPQSKQDVEHGAESTISLTRSTR